ncbi:portal protein, partial [Pseudomonas aeruginosa]|uniref:portal protein n=1 Tax=Pseudomonas aeruginosa TaxID=287 RepID=UPI0039BE0AEE
GQETSGRMVAERQKQSVMSNFHFYDNLCRSVRHTGKILLDLVPHYYDTQRVIRIIGEDGVPTSTTINEKQRNADGTIAAVLNDVT